MTARVFTLPDLGEGLTEAALVRWLVAVGDEITVDQPIAEVETAKSVVEVPSPYAGFVAVLHGDEGADLLVGAPLIEVEPAGPAVPDSTAPDGKVPDATGREAASIDLETTGGSGNVLVGYGTTESTHTGRRRRRASRGTRATTPGVSAAGVSAAGVSAANVSDPAVPTARASEGSIAVISPLVRQLARTRGIDLTTVHATGAGGVITRHDLDSASESAPTLAPAPTAATLAPAPAGATLAPAPAAATLAPAPAGATRVTATTGATDERTGLGIRSATPFGMLRRTVAATMSRSRAEIPEATVWVDVDATDLWALRRRIRLGERHPSLLAFIGAYTLGALARYPMLAGRVAPDGQGMIEFDGVNLGVAVDTPRGLVVPVVRRAEALNLRDLDGTLVELTERARSGAASPAELAGSTFTINNYGSLGVDGSAAIINHPEVAILGVGRFIERPWVVDGSIVPRVITQLSLVFDHRVCDGGTAAGFLRAIADDIESPFERYADVRPGS